MQLNLGSSQRRLRWFGWCAGLAVFFLWVSPLRTNNPCDFYGFWIIGQSVDSVPVNNVYSYGDGVRICAVAKSRASTALSYLERNFRRGITRLDSTGSPLLYSVFKLTSTGDFKKDYDRYRWVCAVIYVLGILALARYLNFPWWSAPFVVFFFTIPYWPYRRDILDANNSSALTGATVGGLLLLRSSRTHARIAAGFALGLLAAFKPTILYAPLLVMLVFTLTDRRSLLLFGTGFFIAMVLALALPSFVLGPACSWKNWWGAASGRAFQMRAMAGGVPGRVFHVNDRTLFKIFAYTMLAAFSAGIWLIFRQPASSVVERFQSRRSPPGFGTIATGALGLTCYLLSGPLVWGHYFTLAVPAAMVTLRPRPYRADQGWPARSIGFLGCALLAFHAWFRTWGWTSWGNYSPFTITGTVLVTAVTLWDVWDSRQWRPSYVRRTSPQEPSLKSDFP